MKVIWNKLSIFFRYNDKSGKLLFKVTLPDLPASAGHNVALKDEQLLHNTAKKGIKLPDFLLQALNMQRNYVASLDEMKRRIGLQNRPVIPLCHLSY